MLFDRSHTAPIFVKIRLNFTQFGGVRLRGLSPSCVKLNFYKIRGAARCLGACRARLAAVLVPPSPRRSVIFWCGAGRRSSVVCACAAAGRYLLRRCALACRLAYALALPRPSGVASLRGAPAARSEADRLRAAGCLLAFEKASLSLACSTPWAWLSSLRRPPILAHPPTKSQGYSKIFSDAPSGLRKIFEVSPLTFLVGALLRAVLRKWDTRSPGEIEQKAKGKCKPFRLVEIRGTKPEKIERG